MFLYLNYKKGALTHTCSTRSQFLSVCWIPSFSFQFLLCYLSIYTLTHNHIHVHKQSIFQPQWLHCWFVFWQKPEKTENGWRWKKNDSILKHRYKLYCTVLRTLTFNWNEPKRKRKRASSHTTTQTSVWWVPLEGYARIL